MIASSSLSIAGPPAAPVSAFTLKPLSVQGLCEAVITIPAFAFRRIVAHEKDWVGAAAVARCTFTSCAATTAAAGRGAELRPDREAGEGDQRVEDLRDRDGLARPDVERAAFGKAERGSVRARHIADVQEIALGVETPVPHDGLGAALLGLGDLLRERGRRETGMLSRAVLVRRPQDHDRRGVTARAARPARLAPHLRRGRNR